MKAIALSLLPVLLLAGCDSEKTTSKPANDPAAGAKYTAHVEAVLKQSDSEAGELHIDNLKEQRKAWLGLLEIMKQAPAFSPLDPAALIDELGLGSAVVSGRSLTQYGDLWLMRHYAHYPDGFPPALGLWGNAKSFTMATLPAATDIAIEFRLNAATMPKIMRQLAGHTGYTGDVKSWLKQKSPAGLPWEEVLSLANVDALWSVEFDSKPEQILKIRTDPALVAAWIPWLVQTYGEAKAIGGLKGWEPIRIDLPGFETKPCVILLEGDDTFIAATSLAHWEGFKASAKDLAAQPAYQAATRHFPETGTMQAYFSPRISSITREWMETMIRENAKLRGVNDVEVKLTPDQPWALCMAPGEAGILTHTAMPFARETRDTRAMTLLSGPGIAFVNMRDWKKGSDRAGCILNIRNVQQSVRSYSGMRAMNLGDEIDWDKVLVYLEMKKPRCPSGGIYTFSKTIPQIGVLACTCSHAKTLGHEPDDYSNW